MEIMDAILILCYWFQDNIRKCSIELFIKPQANSQPAKVIQFWCVVALETRTSDISLNKKKRTLDTPGTRNWNALAISYPVAAVTQTVDR